MASFLDRLGGPAERERGLRGGKSATGALTAQESTETAQSSLEADPATLEEVAESGETAPEGQESGDDSEPESPARAESIAPVSVKEHTRAALQNMGWARELLATPVTKANPAAQARATGAEAGGGAESASESRRIEGQAADQAARERFGAGLRGQPSAGERGAPDGQGRGQTGTNAHAREAENGHRPAQSGPVRFDSPQAERATQAINRAATAANAVSARAQAAGVAPNGGAGGASVQAAGPVSGKTLLRSLGFESSRQNAARGASKQHAPNTPRGAQHTPFDAQVRTVRTQALRGVAAALSHADKSVSLKLEPATLGEMRVHLEQREGGMAARFEVQSAEARRLLDRSMSELRHAMESRGLKVEEIEVRLLPPQEGSESRGQNGLNLGADAGAYGAQTGGAGEHGTSESDLPDRGGAERSAREGMSSAEAEAAAGPGDGEHAHESLGLIDAVA